MERLKVVLARFGYWVVSLTYESVVPGPAGLAFVARCDKNGESRQFLIGYQDGIVIGYRVNW